MVVEPGGDLAEVVVGDEEADHQLRGGGSADAAAAGAFEVFSGGVFELLVGGLDGVIFTLLASVLPDPDDVASKPIQGVVQLVIGVLLLVLAVGQWRKRPRAGQEPVLPKWMQAIDKVTFPAAAGLGLLLSAVNPKNLLMTASAGISIGGAALPVDAMIGALVVFTVVAGSTVGVPVVAFLVASQRLRAPLDALRVWLGRENAVIMAVLLLIIGVTIVGNGVSSFELAPSTTQLDGQIELL